MSKFKTTILFSLSIFTLLITSSISYALGNSLTSMLSPYQKIVRKFTEEGNIHSMKQLDTVYKWYATIHAPEFVAAVQDYAKEFYPEGPSPLAEKFLQQMITPGQTSFFVSLYARDRGLKSMEGAENLWTMTLKVGNNSFAPTSVERIGLTPFQYRFYPYVDKWYRAYRLVFPYDMSRHQNLPITLQLSSVGGVSEVEFKLK